MTARLTSHLQNGVRSLASLEDIEQLSPLVWRILGQNGGAYTLQGTCTYLIGNGKKRLLFDTGDAATSSQYLKFLELALKKSGATEGIEGIIISHWHHDHLGGVRGVQEKFGPNIPVYKNIPEIEEPGFGNGEMSISAYESWPKELFVPINDGDIIKTEGASLKAIYAPGHANDLCVFTLNEEDSMFTSDNVLGEGTGVIINLSQYIHSLKKIKTFNPKRLYPGHGKIVEDGSELIEEYIIHRMKRVGEVLRVLELSASKPLTLDQITREVYGDGLPENLFGPAMYNVKMALDVLVNDSKCDFCSNNSWRAKI